MLMISVDKVMQILREYLICDGLYRDVDEVEIRCKLNMAAKVIPEKESEEWYE